MEFSLKTNREAYNLEAFVKEIGQDLLVAMWGGGDGPISVPLPWPSHGRV